MLSSIVIDVALAAKFVPFTVKSPSTIKLPSSVVDAESVKTIFDVSAIPCTDVVSEE